MTPARTRTGLGLGALLLVAGTAVTGCSGDDKPQEDPTQALTAAKKRLDETSGVQIGLSTERLPSGVNGILDADGVGTHDPAFSGTLKVSAGGITADAEVVAVGDVVYAKLPFATKFARIDPADYGAPDPADLMSPDGGISSLLTAATDVKTGKSVRDGKVVLSSYTATVPGQAVAAVIPSASSSEDFSATFTVTDDDELAKAVLTGPFYPKAKDVTYAITFDAYDTKKKITAP
jgi:lipoprotein LprG